MTIGISTENRVESRGRFLRSARFPAVPRYEDDTLTGVIRMYIACIAVK